MTRIFLIVLLVTATGLTGQAQKRANKHRLQNNKVTVDPSTIAILPVSQGHFPEDEKEVKDATLDKKEMERVEVVLRQCIDDYNKNQHTGKRNTIDLWEYKRQYIAYTTQKGEKVVWVNCFCHADGDDWKKYVLEVLDGGKCYFNVRINLTTGKYYHLMVNGVA